MVLLNFNLGLWELVFSVQCLPETKQGTPPKATPGYPSLVARPSMPVQNQLPKLKIKNLQEEPLHLNSCIHHKVFKGWFKNINHGVAATNFEGLAIVTRHD